MKKLAEMETEIIRLRKRVSVLEGHLNISPADYVDILITDEPYLNLQDQGITPFCNHVKELQERAARTETEEQMVIIRRELEKKFVLKTKDVMALIGFKHYEQARRLMKKAADKYPDLIFEPDNSKGHRIRMKKVEVNNVRTPWELNRLCAQN